MVPDDLRTKAELVEELRKLRARFVEPRQVAAQHPLDRAEEALRISDNQLRDIFENTAVGVYRTTPDGRILLANPALVRMLGYSSFEELAERNLEKEGFEPRYERPMFKERIEKDGYVIGVESAWIRRDGTELVVLENARAVRDEHGKTLYYEGTAEDITERKLAENQTKSLKRQLEFILGATKTGLDIIDSEFNVRYVDPQWAAVYGDYRGKKCYEYFAGVNSVCPSCGIPQALKTKKTFVAEQVLPKENNRPIQVVTVPFQDEKGEWLFAEVNVDITERKKAEDALRDGEQRYRTLFDNAADLIAVVDTKGNFLDLSRRFEEESGYTRREMIGKNVFTSGIITQASAAKTQLYLQKLSVGEQPPIYEIDGITKDGTIIPYELRAVPIRQGDRIVAIQTVLRNISERKKGQEQLRRTQERLAHILRTSPVTIYACQIGGNWADTFMSDNIKSQLGYEPRQFTEDPDFWLKHIHPDDRERILAGLSQLLEEDYHVHEYRFLHRDGTYRWTRDELRVVRDQSSRPLECIGFWTDVTERKKAEDALRGSEEMLRAIFDATTESILLLDNHATILAANKTAAQRFGKTVEELVGLNALKMGASVLPPPVAKSRMEKIKHVFHSGITVRFEDQRKGTVFDNNLYPVFDAEGKVARLAVFARDITEQRRAEKALEEAKLRYQRLFENAPVGIGVATRDGRVLEFNGMMLQMTGYSEEEMRRVNLSETYLDPEDRRILRERLHTEGTVRDYEVQLKRKDGSPYYATVTVVPFTVGGQDVFLTVQRDITERMKMEAALRASEEKYRTLVDSAGESIAVVDDHGTFLFMNTTAADTLAGKPEDYIGKTMWDAFPPQLADRHAAAVREVIATGIGANSIALDELQGRQRWYNTTIEPLRDGSGRIVAAMIVARDIHDLKQAQMQLEQYRENMIRAEHLASVGTLSATVAHELTQPLTIIRLSIEGALAKMEKSSRHKTVAKKLKDSLEEVSNITSIVERFRDFARKSSEKAVRQVDVRVIAERTMELLSERARQAWVNLRLKGMDKLPPIHANQKDVEQMFFALVENAIQAADGKRQHQVIISGVVEGDQIQLRFADDCGGIPPENLDKIFEPFFSTKPPGEGTGLGLCIVQRVTSRAGGKIHVRSKPGKGSTFFVTLPIKAERGP